MLQFPLDCTALSERCYVTSLREWTLIGIVWGHPGEKVSWLAVVQMWLLATLSEKVHVCLSRNLYEFKADNISWHHLQYKYVLSDDLFTQYSLRQPNKQEHSQWHYIDCIPCYLGVDELGKWQSKFLHYKWCRSVDISVPDYSHSKSRI